MKGFAVCVLTAALVCAGAVKHCFPQQREEILTGLSELIYGGQGCVQTVEALGRSLGRGQLREELVQVLGISEEELLPAMAKGDELD